MTFLGITFSNTDLSLLGTAFSLAVIVIGAIIFRKNAFLIKKREKRTKLIDNLLSPFNDAIANIEHGENSYIRIMNALYESQEVSISRAKAIAKKKSKAKIETAWNNYERFYQELGEQKDALQFMATQTEFNKSGMVMLRQHMFIIINSIKCI